VVGERAPEPRVEQGQVVPPERGVDEARIQQGGERILQREPDRRAGLGDQAFRWHPVPWCPLSRAERPAGAHLHPAAPGLGAHLVTDQQAELDAHPAKPIPRPRVLPLAARS